MQPLAKHTVSASEYLAMERASDTKHELVNGEVLAMAGASPAHNLIAVNLGGRLREMVANRPSVVLSSDQRIHVPATDLFAYPDLSVVCGRAERHPEDPHTITNPRVLVEVLSDSTEAYDRGAKFRHYQSISTLEEYVLVASTERRVEHFRRQGSGASWLLTMYGADAQNVGFPSLDGAVSLEAIYDRWESLTAQAV